MQSKLVVLQLMNLKTFNRAMAVCISLMFGRLGCVVGANAVAHLIENHCELVFYLSGSSVIGNSNDVI